MASLHVSFKNSCKLNVLLLDKLVILVIDLFLDNSIIVLFCSINICCNSLFCCKTLNINLYRSSRTPRATMDFPKFLFLHYKCCKNKIIKTYNYFFGAIYIKSGVI